MGEIYLDTLSCMLSRLIATGMKKVTVIYKIGLSIRYMKKVVELRKNVQKDEKTKIRRIEGDHLIFRQPRQTLPTLMILG